MPTCFVVMGFNKKTDYATGRTLDLDKTYRTIIKPAVEAAGVTCVRADEIVHSGVIDVPMYEQLLDADVVVADISTMNPNALYELGVRHALRPFTTIVMGESRIAEKSYPFDLSHLLIRSYVHLGDGIDYEEVERARKELTGAITDHPAGPEARQPRVRAPRRALSGAKRAALEAAALAAAVPAAVPAPSAQRDARAPARPALGTRRLREPPPPATAPRTKLNPKDSYLVQRRGARDVQEQAAERDRRARRPRARYLEQLAPETSNDPETLGLWGAVHKRLFELTERAGGAGRRGLRVREGLLPQERLLQRHQPRVPAERARGARHARRGDRGLRRRAADASPGGGPVRAATARAIRRRRGRCWMCATG